MIITDKQRVSTAPPKIPLAKKTQTHPAYALLPPCDGFVAGAKVQDGLPVHEVEIAMLGSPSVRCVLVDAKVMSLETGGSDKARNKKGNVKCDACVVRCMGGSDRTVAGQYYKLNDWYHSRKSTHSDVGKVNSGMVFSDPREHMAKSYGVKLCDTSAFDAWVDFVFVYRSSLPAYPGEVMLELSKLKPLRVELSETEDDTEHVMSPFASPSVTV